ncbi:enoyl-CoA hydratase/isomerase family protein [Aquimarina agarivorans]|uniref:enoyl-CoA hydratase/isomerase family protein n=1 Tax=Aquimarina agarivorans TaxID=980584 RepID=UPI000248EDCC|nr:enoyl-CoA hydratase-related protein [Aquimarina agarivorans]
MDFKNIKYEQTQQLVSITVNRPAKLNALNAATISELHEAFKVANMDLEVRVIILTGSGEKAFVAGADIKEFVRFNQIEGTELATRGQQLLFDYVENLETPVIAAVNGFALGGGLELAMAAHIRIASENARFGLPEVSLGVIPGYGGTQRLPQLVGKGRAMEMILTGGMISAEKALSYGLVNHVVPQDQLLVQATELAKKIVKNAPSAISAAITTVNAGFDVNQNGFEVEKQAFGSCFGTADFKEGTNAFLNKRKANF